VTLFETETMAELCVKQGQLADGLAIYRRLLKDAVDAKTRARCQRRVAELEAPATGPAGSSETARPAGGEPTVRASRRGDELELAWILPPGTRQPALQLLLMVRPSPEAGIETETRTIRLDSPAGRTTVSVPGLYAARAAAGHLDEGRFVPLARLPDGAL
jgi:hypothetical protein